jgi:hypothetical protein
MSRFAAWNCSADRMTPKLCGVADKFVGALDGKIGTPRA